MGLRDIISGSNVKDQLRANDKTLGKNNTSYKFEGVFKRSFRSYWTWIVNIMKAVVDLEETITNTGEDIEDIQESITTINETIDTINETLEDIEESISTINTTLQNHEQRISALENP